MVKRQGDILFVSIEEIPEEIKIKEDNIVAEGEATGHKHLLQDGILYEDSKGTLFIQVEESAKIVHQEHNPIILPEGNYKVVRQREYEPNGWIRVSD